MNRNLSPVENKSSPSRIAYQDSWKRSAKRAFDIVCALLLLVILAPIMLAVALVIRVNMGRPVLFRQTRPGKNARPFVLLKFRTMDDRVDAHGRALPDPERLTRIGRFLRATSLDEIPQLWNVLRGDMSLVGPRPLLMEYLQRYTAEQTRRHEVCPGITGWAQVNGRQDIPFSRRLELDVWYADHWSLFLDIKIILMTIARLKGDGVRSGQNIREVDDLGFWDVPASRVDHQ